MGAGASTGEPAVDVADDEEFNPILPADAAKAGAARQPSVPHAQAVRVCVWFPSPARRLDERARHRRHRASLHPNAGAIEAQVRPHPRQHEGWRQAGHGPGHRYLKSRSVQGRGASRKGRKTKDGAYRAPPTQEGWLA